MTCQTIDFARIVVVAYFKKSDWRKQIPANTGTVVARDMLVKFDLVKSSFASSAWDFKQIRQSLSIITTVYCLFQK